MGNNFLSGTPSPPARFTLSNRVSSIGWKCSVVDTALFLASRTLFDTCLAFSKFLMNEPVHGESPVGLPHLSLLVAIVFSVLQNDREGRERGAPQTLPESWIQKGLKPLHTVPPTSVTVWALYPYPPTPFFFFTNVIWSCRN